MKNITTTATSTERPIPESGETVGLTAVIPSSMARETSSAESVLVSENRLLRMALENMPHGLCMFDGADRLLLSNRRFAELWGLPEELTRPGTTYAQVAAGTKGFEKPHSVAQPVPLPGSSGVRRREWQLDDGRTIGVVVTRLADASSVALHEDVTQQRKVEEQITLLARHDTLTGLPNRLAMAEGFSKMLARNARGEEFAVLCVDLDRFKAVNDGFGHAVGDILLTQVAQRLRACVRDTEFVARLGGDEFAVLQCGAPQPVGSTALARRIIAVLSEPFDLGGHSAQIGASIGISIAPFDGESPDALLKSADMALYRAKADGRGIVRYFEPQMDASTQARRLLEADLRTALALGQFHLVYQPQLNLNTRQVTGAEALLRWTHPERGNISPVEFIPLAEETGLIVPIGRWVLEQACRDAVQWPSQVRIAVNASLVQFSKGHVLKDVRAALEKSGLQPARLEVEITESVLMQDPKRALALMQDLRKLGVALAMDDFGTGYSSLNYLLNFPLQRIKIDRAFIQNVDMSPDAQAIVRAITGLGVSLGMAVTVEGVETLAQLLAVRAQGCFEVQGYFFSKPSPTGQIADLINTLPISPVWRSLAQVDHG